MEIKIENFGTTGVGRVIVKLLELTVCVIHFGPTDAIALQSEAEQIAQTVIEKWQEIYSKND